MIDVIDPGDGAKKRKKFSTGQSFYSRLKDWANKTKHKFPKHLCEQVRDENTVNEARQLAVQLDQKKEGLEGEAEPEFERMLSLLKEYCAGESRAKPQRNRGDERN